MKNSTDKQFREKLSSTEFPFDPQAWEQMEAMLDKKKKRGIFFWWFTGGIAAVLLLTVATIGWGVYLMDEDDRSGDEQTQMSVNEERVNANNVQQVVVNATEPTPLSKAEEEANNNSTHQIKHTVTSTEKQSASGSLIIANNSNQENTESVKAHAEAHKNTAHQKHQRTNIISKRGKLERVLEQLAYDENSGNQNGVAVAENPYQQEVEMLRAAAVKKSSEENIGLNRREASMLEAVSENATTDFDKKEEDALPKKKKKIFNYSIGVLANASGSSVGKQEGQSFFYKQPSYMAGITHNFLFANRFAISNSILYSQTSFKVYSPKSVSFVKAPLDYTSHINELAIPIGIKVYPVAKNNFRFYIGAGVINHIKLKETFSYHMPPDTPSNIIATPQFDVNNIPPSQTDFTGAGFPYEKVNTMGALSTERVNTNDFSINSAKRYYASFYASMGVEYIAQKHWIVFAEPMFDMSLQKIGVQDKRKYNLGLSGGLRYQF